MGGKMQISIKDLIINYFKNWKWTLGLFLIICLSLVLFIIYGVNVKYQSYITFMLGNDRGNEKLDISDYDLNNQIINDYIVIAKSNKIIERAIINSGFRYRVSDIKNNLEITYEEDTQYLQMTLTGSNKDEIPTLVYDLYSSLEVEIKEVFKIDNMYLIDSNKKAYQVTNKIELIIYAVIISLIISFVIITIILFLKPYILKILKR